MTVAMFTKSAAAALGGAQQLIKDDVYVAAVPLRAAKGPPQLLMSASYSLNLSWDLQHFMVIIKPASRPPSLHQAIVFDFQPKDPENVFTALAVMSGRSVPGAVFRRTLKRVPRNRCWYVGSSEDCEGVAAEFSEKWGTQLEVGHHDCRHFTNAYGFPVEIKGLVELLTGEELVLERLRRNVLKESNTS